MREGEDTDWYYSIWKDGGEFIRSKNYILQPLVIGYIGEYQCFGDHKISPPFRKESNKVSLTVSGKFYHQDQLYDLFIKSVVDMITLFGKVLENQ